jgi:hypothetical protein
METGLLSALELEIGIMCACLPSVQVLFKPLFNRIFGWAQGSMAPSSGYQIRDDPDEVHHASKMAVSKGSLGGIRLTTTIRQDAPSPTESEIYLPLHGITPQGKELTTLSPARIGTVKAEAWA